MFGILQYYWRRLLHKWILGVKVQRCLLQILLYIIALSNMAYMSVVMLYCGGWCPHERGRATTGVMSPLSRAGHTGDTGDTVWTNRIPPPWSPVTARGGEPKYFVTPFR